MLTFGRMVVLVDDYEKALEFYVHKLGLVHSVDMDAGERRFVHLTFPEQPNAGIWLLKIETENDKAALGQQAGDQPIAVVYTDSFEDEYARLVKAGVRFLEEPVTSETGIFAHFVDLYGNKLILVQLSAP